MESITIIAVVAPVITGFGGIYFGHKLASSRIKQEINEIEEKDKRTETRHKEEKFENAIQRFMLTGKLVSNRDRYNNFTLRYITWKERDRLSFLDTNNIRELSEFFDWMSKKFNDAGQEMSYHDFWKSQILI